MDWVTKHNVPNLLRAAPNVQVVGMGGLKNVHLDDFKDALHKSALLEEVRACGESYTFTALSHGSANMAAPSRPHART